MEQVGRGGEQFAPVLVPASLPAKDNYHPKRNQARQKLSTLPPERFRQLAMDVFYELERRFPRFAGVDMERVGSPTGSLTSSRRGPSPQYSSLSGGPMNGRSYLREAMPRPEPNGGPSPVAAPLRTSTSGGTPTSEYGPISPRVFRPESSTAIDSPAVEKGEDLSSVEEDGEDEDALGFEKHLANKVSNISSHSRRDQDSKGSNREYQEEIDRLRGRVAELDVTVHIKEKEIATLNHAAEDLKRANQEERSGWTALKISLEQQAADSNRLHQQKCQEVDRLRLSHATAERSLRQKLEDAHKQARTARSPPPASLADNEDWRSRHDALQAELDDQRQLVESVRLQAVAYLSEMRSLTSASAQSIENEERLIRRVTALEDQVRAWKERYVQCRTQLMDYKATSIGLGAGLDWPSAGRTARGGIDEDLVHEKGMIRDTQIVSFQLAMDELLYTARRGEVAALMKQMKAVVLCVRDMTSSSTTITNSASRARKSRMCTQQRPRS